MGELFFSRALILTPKILAGSQAVRHSLNRLRSNGDQPRISFHGTSKTHTTIKGRHYPFASLTSIRDEYLNMYGARDHLQYKLSPRTSSNVPVMSLYLYEYRSSMIHSIPAPVLIQTPRSMLHCPYGSCTSLCTPSQPPSSAVATCRLSIRHAIISSRPRYALVKNAVARTSLHDSGITDSLHRPSTHRSPYIPLEALPIRSQILRRLFIQRIRRIGFEEQKLTKPKSTSAT